MYSSLFARDLVSEMARLQRDVQRAFDTATPSIRGFSQGFPALNVGSTPASVEIYAFAPGLDPSKIEIDLDRRVLTIAGERASSVASDGGAKSTAHINERFGGRFRRVVSLPEDIDADGVNAEYRDGVLHVTVKRRESTQPRRIAVQ
jgi:HSP20 family protein